jgi:hypothetical protein
MCGLGMTVLGGGCTIMWLGQPGDLFSDGGLGLVLLAVSIAALVAGLSTLWLGFKMFGGRRDGGEG